ncbi:unnamed protein product [Gongylonema pulchrum]|uniref:Uncharacterized protein n=1 Tax=Gongylonema pulchrum TaxID=637853 RepID=A0A183E719_9BILA|nr:unnamed protein product [Gongylonema pulchrum]
MSISPVFQSFNNNANSISSGCGSGNCFPWGSIGGGGGGMMPGPGGMPPGPGGMLPGGGRPPAGGIWGGGGGGRPMGGCGPCGYGPYVGANFAAKRP